LYCGCCYRCRCDVVVAAAVAVAVVAIISMAVFVWRGCVLYACDCGCSAIDKSVVIAVMVGGRHRTSRSCSSASSPAWDGVGTCAGATAAAKPSMASQRAQSSSSCDGQMRLRSAPMVTWGADSIWAGLRSCSVVPIHSPSDVRHLWPKMPPNCPNPDDALGAVPLLDPVAPPINSEWFFDVLSASK